MADWTNEILIKFVELYQSEDILWNAKHRNHKDKTKMNDAWCRISKILNIPIEDLKNKKNSIMATFRGHLRKKKASIKSGAGQNDIYRPIWFLYDQMESFLGKLNDCNLTLNTEEGNISQTIDQETLENDKDDGNEFNSPNNLTSQPTQENILIQRQTSRRRGNPEVEEAWRQMKRAFNTLESVLNKKHEDDEYDLYGRILAHKLRKLPENERELFMYDIDGMFVQRYHRLNNPLLSSRQPTFSGVFSTGMNTANDSSSTVTS